MRVVQKCEIKIESSYFSRAIILSLAPLPRSEFVQVSGKRFPSSSITTPPAIVSRFKGGLNSRFTV